MNNDECPRCGAKLRKLFYDEYLPLKSVNEYLCGTLSYKHERDTYWKGENCIKRKLSATTKKRNKTIVKLEKLQKSSC